MMVVTVIAVQIAAMKSISVLWLMMDRRGKLCFSVYEGRYKPYAVPRLLVYRTSRTVRSKMVEIAGVGFQGMMT